MPVNVLLKDKIRTDNLSARAGKNAILKNISLAVRENEVLAAIGPAGSGKSTFLRCLNRMTDLEEGLTVEGRVFLGEEDIFRRDADVASLRRRVGTVFAVPTPLPMTIKENLSLGLRFQGSMGREAKLMENIQRCLRAAFLWDEVKDRLNESALKLSGGQQQRLCLARSLMVKPEVLLLDEPCSGLDPISTAKIEEAMQGLKKEMSIVLVTNNVKQASRSSDRTAFLFMGELIELDDTSLLFTSPKDQRTSDYVSGRFG